MGNMYLVNSLTNWNTDSSLENALRDSYFNRLGEQSEIFIVDNNIVTSFGQIFSINVKPEYHDDFFAIKLLVKELNISDSIKQKYSDFIEVLYQNDLHEVADAMPEISLQTVEVYAVNNTDSKLLTTFNAHPADMANIAFELENCEEAYRILNISSTKNDEAASA